MRVTALLLVLVALLVIFRVLKMMVQTEAGDIVVKFAVK